MVTDRPPERQTAFSERLRSRALAIRSWLCVGLDPDLDVMPAGFEQTPQGMTALCGTLIDATLPFAAAFKINLAFFERMGWQGWRVLEMVRERIPSDVPVIADAKRGDIASTARAYAVSLFSRLSFDAATVNPYMGWDSLEPFLAYPGKGVFVLCKTSNPGSADLQDCIVEEEPLYMRVARKALQLEGPAAVGLVVGATHPAALSLVRGLDQHVILLVPGVGAQGATLEETMAHAANEQGINALISVSRSLLSVHRGESLPTAAARNAENLAGRSFRFVVNS